MQIRKCDICGTGVDTTNQKCVVWYAYWKSDGKKREYDFCEKCAKKVIEAVNKVIEDNRNAK